MTMSRHNPRGRAAAAAAALLASMSILGGGAATAQEQSQATPIPAPMPAPVMPAPAPMPDPWPGILAQLGAAPPAPTSPAPESQASYSDDLDGWILESLAVMDHHGIPGSYEGIRRNVMRESNGDRWAVNNYDSNAAAGTPSKGLLQVIDPTFRAYRLEGTSEDIFDPVANITAACHYAAATYGTIDNVDGPY
ncbi:transglycosylase SLT domain-containing protein [Nocardia altamirensis]|uniref:transglycosylase SLT domain-containing protein n=1 Tax=Nocardia altamirensis TaxID=472158 RepID=UPI000A075EFF|nr:transglycosylase SLT domain-containing protein [Nocardia altamirensis]